MAIRDSAALLLVLAAIVAPPLAAQQCVGFTDVVLHSTFCNDVKWLKNRAITSGCTATEFCPEQPVSRLAMAAFMHRVEKVLAPKALSVEASGGALDIASTTPLCETTVVSGLHGQRTPVADGAVSFEVTGFQDVFTAIAVSRNGGAWQVSQDSFVTWATAGVRKHVRLVAEGGLFATGEDLRFALLIARGGFGLSQSVMQWSCQLSVRVQNFIE